MNTLKLCIHAALGACAMLALSLVLGLRAPIAHAADGPDIELGKTRYSESCGGFCHGAGGRGGRAPCLVCGKFKRGGTDEEIINNIANGIAGTPMGAFGEKLSKEDIVALVAYLRAEEKKKKEAEQ
jgi:mono/diheme cytochrome c family protein